MTERFVDPTWVNDVPDVDGCRFAATSVMVNAPDMNSLRLLKRGTDGHAATRHWSREVFGWRTIHCRRWLRARRLGWKTSHVRHGPTVTLRTTHQTITARTLVMPPSPLA